MDEMRAGEAGQVIEIWQIMDTFHDVLTISFQSMIYTPRVTRAISQEAFILVLVLDSADVRHLALTKSVLLVQKNVSKRASEARVMVNRGYGVD